MIQLPNMSNSVAPVNRKINVMKSDVIKLKINLIFLIKPFLYMTKNSRQNLKYLENEKSF